VQIHVTILWLLFSSVVMVVFTSTHSNARFPFSDRCAAEEGAKKCWVRNMKSWKWKMQFFSQYQNSLTIFIRWNKNRLIGDNIFYLSVYRILQYLKSIVKSDYLFICYGDAKCLGWNPIKAINYWIRVRGLSIRLSKDHVCNNNNNNTSSNNNSNKELTTILMFSRKWPSNWRMLLILMHKNEACLIRMQKKKEK